MVPTSRPISVSRGIREALRADEPEGYPPMKIKKIAATTLVPAAVAGVTVSSWAAVQAATGHSGAHIAAHHAGPGRPVHPARSPSQQSDRNSPVPGAGKRGAEARTVRSRQDRASHRAHATASHRARTKAAASEPAQSTAPSSSVLLAGMSAFEQCVAWRESGDNPTASSAGLFGILPSTWASLGYQGTAGTSSVALQKAAFDRLYAEYGTSPWAPYDGC